MHNHVTVWIMKQYAVLWHGNSHVLHKDMKLDFVVMKSLQFNVPLSQFCLPEVKIAVQNL